MASPPVVVNLEEKLATFDDHWKPKIVGEMNDLHLKLVKVRGEFVWHSHEDTDEFFMVISGRLTIRLRDDDDVVLDPGEFFIVPRGVEHCPVAEAETAALLIEPAGTLNTGDSENGELTADAEWI